ncbi:hypothetical protein CO656_19175 [Sinorhizobium sp. FG01]|uniref:Uncharacterized protein n=1 Tax=Sinorhizobium americanum TaxID=194963 RepID=A0A2S3YVR0_9HYPH|nr:hypothetical protein CO656_19175 [Sinorhizobium sp. FG01]POH35713.1 hypothetical protein ATY31_00300 [Sinorhizobium americanum]
MFSPENYLEPAFVPALRPLQPIGRGHDYFPVTDNAFGRQIVSNVPPAVLNELSHLSGVQGDLARKLGVEAPERSEGTEASLWDQAP